MYLKILVSFLLPYLAIGQSPKHRSYDWRIPEDGQEGLKYLPLIPYERQPVSVNYPSNVDPLPYHPESYPEYPKLPYKYPNDPDQSISPYESYGPLEKEELDMASARVGGFAGSGDTRGFGAYDFPKERRNHHQEVPKNDPEFEEMLEIGRNYAGYFGRDSERGHSFAPLI